MRASLAISLLLCVACCARSDEPAAEETSTGEIVTWQDPFEAISASDAADALVLILITNEDPFLIQEHSDRVNKKQKATKRAAAKKANHNPPVWCSDVLAFSYRKALDHRVDLRDRLKLQSIAAGLPRELTGGTDRNTPARAVLALCDGNYRLLGLTVGVPDTDDLLTLIEDGEDVAAILELHAEQPTEIVKLIAERSSERLSRLWRGALGETLLAMEGDVGEDDARCEASFEGWLRLLSDIFEPVYLADVKLRFGLTDATDQTRLVILEQHPEARRPWCESIIPFIADRDFLLIWQELVESIWGHQPITADGEAKQLLEWYDLQAKTDSVVLSLQAPFHLRRLPWPPILDKAAKRGVGWQEVHNLALEHPFRTVQPQQLAVLIRQRPLDSVDIQQPSMARYLFLEPNKKSPLVVREADPPGRFAGLLKRSKSSLVKE